MSLVKVTQCESKFNHYRKGKVSELVVVRKVRDRVRAFGRILEDRGYAVAYQDERFTTRRARALGAADEDEAAAVQILELYLMGQAPQGERGDRELPPEN